MIANCLLLMGSVQIVFVDLFIIVFKNKPFETLMRKSASISILIFIFVGYSTSAQKLPSFIDVISTFFKNYTVPKENTYILFEKKQDGWFVVEGHYGDTDTSNLQQFWSTKSNDYVSLNYPVSTNVDSATLSTYVNDYLTNIAPGFEQYCFQRNRYYGYPGWDWDVINSSSIENANQDTLLESLGRAYSNYASAFLPNTNHSQIEVKVQFEKNTVWLSQKQMAELFDKDSDTIGLHLKNIFAEEELVENSTTEFFSVVKKEGKRKFWNEEITKRTAEPYAMKEFKNRWYVIAKDLKDGNVKTFALDRFTNLEITNRKFEYPKDYNIGETYRYCFGIINPNNEEPQNILLSFDPFQGKYIKSLPLHKTQEIVVDNEEELQIKLELCITDDLVMELLSFGDDVKVLNPQSLAEEIKKAHQQAYNNIERASNQRLESLSTASNVSINSVNSHQ